MKALQGSAAQVAGAKDDDGPGDFGLDDDILC